MALEIPLLVRPISAQDEVQWRDLWQAYLAFYETALPEETYRETFRRIVACEAGMAGLMAFWDDHAVGLVHYLYHTNFWKAGKTCYLQDLFTAQQVRGKGVARALMEAVFATAAKTGVLDVYWLTAETNYAGRMLYDRVGVKTPFIVYERVA
jgi:GNAT superfamily N-acetyltransferase